MCFSEVQKRKKRKEIGCAEHLWHGSHERHIFVSVDVGAVSLWPERNYTILGEKRRKLEGWPKKKKKRFQRECLHSIPYMETCMRLGGCRAWCNAPACWESVESMTAEWEPSHKFAFFVHISQVFSRRAQRQSLQWGRHIYLNQSEWHQSLSFLPRFNTQVGKSGGGMPIFFFWSALQGFSRVLHDKVFFKIRGCIPGER